VNVSEKDFSFHNWEYTMYLENSSLSSESPS
jgi:hypothetical protein